jgi:hypothetical protein
MSEILGTLFKYLMALLAVGSVVVILYLAFGANKTSTAISDITQLRANTVALYNTQSAFTSLTTAVAIAGGLAPTSMIAGTALTNPWGGTVTIAVNATNAAQFDVTEPSVPKDACAKMIVGMSNPIAVTVNTVAQTLPLEAGAAVTACNAAANTIIFTFGH